MFNPYTPPHLSLYSDEKDILMVSANAVGLPNGITPPTGGNGNSGVIELPPVPISKGESYIPPSVYYVEEPTDILMASEDDPSDGDGDEGDGSGSLNPPNNSQIIFPPVPI